MLAEAADHFILLAEQQVPADPVVVVLEQLLVKAHLELELQELLVPVEAAADHTHVVLVPLVLTEGQA
jgi:hypothetical protein